MVSLSFKNDRRIGSVERELLRKFCSSLENDIVELANKLGMKVYSECLPPYERGYLEFEPLYNTKSGFRIVVNKNDRPEVQNFTVAHEIAHFLLHRKDAARRKAHRADKDEPFTYIEPWEVRQEGEANLFAAILLMPPNLFIPAFSRLSGRVADMAKLFFVSERAVEIQIEQLALKR